MPGVVVIIDDIAVVVVDVVKGLQVRKCSETATKEGTELMEKSSSRGGEVSVREVRNSSSASVVIVVVVGGVEAKVDDAEWAGRWERFSSVVVIG